jgi:hypothetical protein
MTAAAASVVPQSSTRQLDSQYRHAFRLIDVCWMFSLNLTISEVR